MKIRIAFALVLSAAFGGVALAADAPAPVHNNNVMLTCQDGSTANSSVRCWAKNMDSAQNKTCTATISYQHRFSTDKPWSSDSKHATKAVPAGQNVEIFTMSRPVHFLFTGTTLTCSDS